MMSEYTNGLLMGPILANYIKISAFSNYKISMNLPDNLK